MTPIQPATDLARAYRAALSRKQPKLFHRVWAMPNRDTFSIKPIGEYVKRDISKSQVSIDPFARHKQ